MGQRQLTTQNGEKTKLETVIYKFPFSLSTCQLYFGFCFSSCESFNSIIRGQNIHSNRLAPSRDIATRLSVIDHFRYLANGGTYDGKRCVYNEYTMPIHYYPFFRAGTGLIELYNKPHIQKFINGNVSGTKKIHW